LPFLLLTGILEEGQLLNKNLDAKKIADKLRTSVLEYKNLRTHDMVNLGNLRTGWPISNATEVKIEYLHYGSSKRADFFVDDRGMPKLYIHKDMPRQTLC
jgi:hypothetical protein